MLRFRYHSDFGGGEDHKRIFPANRALRECRLGAEANKGFGERVQTRTLVSHGGRCPSWNWTMSTFRNCHDSENCRCVHVRMGGLASRFHPLFSAPRSPSSPCIYLWYYVEFAFFFFLGAKDAQLRYSIFLNTVGFN